MILKNLHFGPENAGHFFGQREYFDNGNTKSYEFRISKLRELKAQIEKNEDNVINALTLDLCKPLFESYTSEIGVVYTEINHAIRKLKSWMKPRKVPNPIYLHPSSRYISS